jgi:hypothetical protein
MCVDVCGCVWMCVDVVARVVLVESKSSVVA